MVPGYPPFLQLRGTPQIRRPLGTPQLGRCPDGYSPSGVSWPAQVHAVVRPVPFFSGPSPSLSHPGLGLASYTLPTIDLSGRTTTPSTDISMHGARGSPGSILQHLLASSELKYEPEPEGPSLLRGPPPHHRGSGPAECTASYVDRSARSPAPVGGFSLRRVGCGHPRPIHRSGSPATTRSSPWLQTIAAASSVSEKPFSTRTLRA